MKFLRIVLIFVSAVLYFNVSASCNTKADVITADNLWASTFALDDPKKISDLYDTNSVLMPTFSEGPITNSESREKYFKNLFQRLANATVTYKTKSIVIFTGGAASSGTYIFCGVAKNKKECVNARYTFVYRDDGKNCVLITHHSSVVPINPH